MDRMLENWNLWLWPACLVAGAAALALIGNGFLFWAISRYADRTGSVLAASVNRHCRTPARFLLPLLGISIVMPSVPLHPKIEMQAKHILVLALVGFFTWLLIRIIHVAESVILSRYRMDIRDNLRARSVATQIQLLRKVLVVLVSIFGLSAALMTFDSIRQLGASILASAGIAGLILGIAAQRSLAALIAGIQMALTQPIRVDDVVIVEQEWGRIEETTLTYVVVRIWDLRRLVLPTTYFLEKPFQNWTRVSANLLGSVYLHVDYTIPVEEVRKELKRLLEASDLWDRQVCGLQVTDTTEHSMELRALMSAADSSDAWQLRCEIREKLIVFVQQNYPGGLPRIRAEVAGRKG